MIVLVPFFGDRARFRPLLDAWIAAKAKAAPDLAWFALTDEPLDYGTPNAVVSLEGFRDLLRPGQPFDVKGALVSAALLRFPEPLLVLDADAVLARDPRPGLAPFSGVSIAMPLDGGAVMHGRAPLLSPPYGAVAKVCAGVQFFGMTPGRSRLVAGYRRAFEELRALPRLPWSPPLPHLLEQYAWSLAMNRRGGAILPVTYNWAPHFLGESPDAVVNHHYGFKKWSIPV